ncbi:outer membrane beta-barrel protein [Gilvimarinus agarilyticus]|uniref:outer membrane beta-barrel protein n=1 Tax=Gilvimarinus agarilyticus TaxID=679259 RepID=UPI00059FA50C|nr:outer membrane beta-barrel protein [Gilvimarinus agarilyticus]
MKKLLCTLLATGALSATAFSHAGTESGLYLGGSLGNAEIDYDASFSDFDDIDFKDDDTAYKIFGGYNFGVLPLLDLAVEGGYVDFGTQEQFLNDALGNQKTEVTGWTASGLVGVDLGPVGLFGKAGVITWDGDISNFEFDTSDSGTDAAYGIGAKIQLGSFAVRAEYEIFELDDADMTFYSIGGVVTF